MRPLVPRGLALAVTFGLAQASAASACLPYLGPERSPSEKRADARRQIDSAYTIIDAEVVRPGGFESGPALLYAHRVLKGSPQRWFEVGTNGNDSCAQEFLQVGSRMRLLIYAGEHGLFAMIPMVEDRYVDRLLGSDRRRNFPYFAGPRRRTRLPRQD